MLSLGFIGVWWCVVVSVMVNYGVPVNGDGGNKMVCYYASWSHYRQGGGKYSVNDVPVEHCTHVIYAFAVLDSTSLKLTPHDSHLDKGLNNYGSFLQLRRRNPQVKLLLGLGGWTDSRSDKYSRLVSNKQHRNTFTQHVINFLTTHGFDGLDLDWEFPTHHGPASDKQGFTKWVEELSTAFKPNGLILTAAVSAGKSIIESGYDVPSISKALDQIHLMTYDFHGSWESSVANHAPLFPATGTNSELSVDFAVQYWMKKGTPARKLVIGVPLYGRSWTLAGSDTGVGARASGAGRPGPLTKEAGILAYYEICQAQQNGWTKKSGADGPYLTNGNQWVGYDDINTVKRKAEYVRNKGLGGVMLWETSMDDFQGSCRQGNNPLISTISQTLGTHNTHGSVEPLTRPPRWTTKPTVSPNTTPRPQGSQQPAHKINCREHGYSRDPKSCSYFYRCVGDRVFHYKCPAGLHWHQEKSICNWPEIALCKRPY